MLPLRARRALSGPGGERLCTVHFPGHGGERGESRADLNASLPRSDSHARAPPPTGPGSTLCFPKLCPAASARVGCRGAERSKNSPPLLGSQGSQARGHGPRLGGALGGSRGPPPWGPWTTSPTAPAAIPSRLDRDRQPDPQRRQPRGGEGITGYLDLGRSPGCGFPSASSSVASVPQGAPRERHWG